MKKVVSLVLVLMLAIGLMAGAMAEDTLRIGLSMHNQTADWAVQFKDTFLALGEENGNEGFEGMRVMVRRGPGDILLLDHSAQSFYQSVSRVFYGKTGGK